MRILAAPILGLLLVGILANPAAAKSYAIDFADVDIVVNDDASLSVTETLGYVFSGSFSGAYRDIPLRHGESIVNVAVADSGGTYQPGGCVALGCSSPAGTYGVTTIPGYVRIVWHYSAVDAARDFTITYDMHGVATAYDDVIDVNLQVWGDQWPVGVDEVTARVHVPGAPQAGDVYVWGHPYGIDGSTTLGDDGVSPSLTARNVPSETWVELRSVFPSSLVGSTAGARNSSGDGLESIRAEETLFAEQSEAESRAARSGFFIGIVAAVALAVGLGLATYLRYGREPRIDYDLDYEHEPLHRPVTCRGRRTAVARESDRKGIHCNAVRPDPEGRNICHSGAGSTFDVGWASPRVDLGSRA